jgi:hypothetical protein
MTNTKVKTPKFISAANDKKTETSIFADANKILDDAKDKFPVVMVIGLTKENLLDVTTNIPQYPTLQWLLNRASFELLLHEKQTAQTASQKEENGSQAN